MNHPKECEVAVIVSANVEWRAISPLFPDVSRQMSALGEWFETTVGRNNQAVLLFHGGWGKIAAAASTQYVIHHCSPRLIINLGTCGGLRGKVEPGAIILVDRTVVYDIHEQMGDHDEHIAHYSTDIELKWLGESFPHAVVRSLMVSGDRDLMVEDLPRLSREFGAIVGDWESGSIAWVARKHGIPTLILLGVSDLVGHTGGEAYDGKMHVFENNTQAIMSRLVTQLPDWIELFIQS